MKVKKHLEIGNFFGWDRIATIFAGMYVHTRIRMEANISAVCKKTKGNIKLMRRKSKKKIRVVRRMNLIIIFFSFISKRTCMRKEKTRGKGASHMRPLDSLDS